MNNLKLFKFINDKENEIENLKQYCLDQHCLSVFQAKQDMLTDIKNFLETQNIAEFMTE